MRVHVDPEKCQGHNRCYAIAPELFDVDDLGYAHELNDGVVSRRARGQGAARRRQLSRVRDRDHGVTSMTSNASDRPGHATGPTDFDHTDPQWVADPYPIWDELRDDVPGRAHRPLRRHVAAGASRRRRRGRVRHRALHVALGRS